MFVCKALPDTTPLADIATKLTAAEAGGWELVAMTHVPSPHGAILYAFRKPTVAVGGGDETVDHLDAF
ncbi:MAG TPA: hypothetical protein VGM56_09555 [Byssovorax sp.]|jgi:hypothetical protein